MESESPATIASEMLKDTAATVSGRGGLRARVLSGSVIMLFSSGMVGAINLIYNLTIAHRLGAASFGHASAVYTVLMLLSSVTLSFQLLCSKFVARSDALPRKLGIYHFLHRRAWGFGIALAALIAAASPIVSRYLNLPTRHYIDLLAAATIFFVPLGVRRGFMQGMYDFKHLALNFILEVVVKLIGALLLIDAGLGVSGVITAVVASIAIPYLIAMPRRQGTAESQPTIPAALGEGVQTSVFFVGQVVINNLDIVLVKHFFSATEAGVYAAVALVGRVVYMLSWSVVSGMFPFSARVSRTQERDGRAVLSTALLLVVLITSLFTLGVWLAPQQLWHKLLGSGFPFGQQNPYASLLVLYAATTGIYSLAVVLMSYEISRKIGNVSWLQLGFSGAIVAGIYLLHNTLQDVITVQLVVMLLLLLVVSIPFLRAQSKAEEIAAGLAESAGRMRKIRRVGEEAVIAEFLKSEFFHSEFDHYRDQFRELVTRPNLSSARENELRRALLFLRRGRMWRELPPDTQWWEVELQDSDLERLRIFPRNHWRRLADGNFYLSEMVNNIRQRVESDPSDPFAVKLLSVTEELATAAEETSAVLLIGVDEIGPLTIIEGNHRMAAASLLGPSEVRRRFRFLCGLSPHMTDCCWYQTDLGTLWRYAKNFVTYFLDDHDVIIEQALRRRLEQTARASEPV